MTYSIPIPSGLDSVPARPLTKEAFAPFGTVISSPVGNSGNVNDHRKAVPENVPDANSAPINEDNAARHSDIPMLMDLYRRAPSKKRGRPVTQLLVSMPVGPASDRKGKDDADEASSTLTTNGTGTTYHLQRLERSRFSSKTIIPFGRAASDPTSAYLVIVAPSLPVGRGSIRPPPFPTSERRLSRSIKDLLSQARPAPFPTPDPRPRRSFRDVQADARPPPFPIYAEGILPRCITFDSPKPPLPGPGLPDLNHLQAFIVQGGQAVTFAPGVWHASIIALGSTSLEFLLVRFVNGVQSEDTQEVQLVSGTERGGIPIGPLGEIKAKL
ncbi:MAG: bifunctional AP-4-A phosphorylase/ADP sulfurylase [Watsoniomyces obsoletus]|nr:MAG: bifunctional AP-4-A phosphorylase/ADP sulfurylase [Watsoniomyces obsoletus]